MNRRGRSARLGGALILLLVLLSFSACGFVERFAEQVGNPVVSRGPYTTDATAAALHARLFVADLHADTLLSARDPTQPVEYGQLDLSRLRQGGVRLQVFSIVTNMPVCPGFAHCARFPNLVSLLAAAQGWPVGTWMSDQARALYQAEKLRTITAASPELVLLRDRDDLLHVVAAGDNAHRIGALLAVEGAQAVGDDVAGVDRLADAGVRVLGLAHYFDNAVSGSAHGMGQGGITPFGRRVVRRALARGMIIDLAHAAPRAIDDFLAFSDGSPFVLSHTGLQTVCDNPRNLTERQVRDVVKAGGLIGIGAWSVVLCLGRQDPPSAYAAEIARTVIATAALAERERPGHGDEYVALGSDFDGWVRAGFDASGWPLVTQALMRAGLHEASIARIMGGNVCRLLLRALPGKGTVPPANACGGTSGR